MSDAVPGGELLFFQSEDGVTRVECRFVEDSIWLTQSWMAELYQTTPQNITTHIKAIYDEGEVDPEATCKEYLQVQNEGGRDVERMRKFYSLPTILAVGYRVRSVRGTQFRRWATDRLEQYLIKGFVMDDERLKNPPLPGSGVPDHFDELLERIRDIRSSERRMYLRIRELFSLAADYEPTLSETQKFFGTMQNKLHYTVTGLTAAELIQSRANPEEPNMGLTSWKSEVVRKGDVTVAKNYLHESEIGELNRVVVMWLDYAEDQVLRRKQVFMKDWQTKLDAFLKFNERDVLENAGKIRKEDADEGARQAYEEFQERRREMLEIEGATDSIEVLEETDRKISGKSDGGVA
jgi:hypothetical protein